MASRTPAQTIRAALEVLESLPRFASATPELVMGDSDDVSGLVWCDPDHTDRDPLVCCDCALGVDMVVAQLADVTAGLLAAREPLVDWLKDMLATYGSLKSAAPTRRPRQGSNLAFAVAIAEAVLAAARPEGAA